MADANQAAISRLSADLVEMTRLVQAAMARATDALLTADVHTAEAVISDDVQIDTINNTIEAIALETLYQHELTKPEVRAAVGALRMSTTLERMGDLAAHVAKQARLRYPYVSVPAELQGTFARMGTLANHVVECTGKVIATRDLSWAADLAASDQEMDEIHRELFATVLSEDWNHGVEAAIDVTLLSRYFERFADHGVTVARRVAFIVTEEPYGVTDLTNPQIDE